MTKSSVHISLNITKQMVNREHHPSRCRPGNTPEPPLHEWQASWLSPQPAPDPPCEAPSLRHVTGAGFHLSNSLKQKPQPRASLPSTPHLTPLTTGSQSLRPPLLPPRPLSLCLCHRPGHSLCYTGLIVTDAASERRYERDCDSPHLNHSLAPSAIEREPVVLSGWPL